MNTKETIEKLKQVAYDLEALEKLKRSPSSRTLEEWKEIVTESITLLQNKEKDIVSTLENIRDMCLDAANGNWPHKEACKVVSATCTRKLSAIAAQQETESV